MAIGQEPEDKLVVGHVLKREHIDADAGDVQQNQLLHVDGEGSNGLSAAKHVEVIEQEPEDKLVASHVQEREDIDAGAGDVLQIQLLLQVRCYIGKVCNYNQLVISINYTI